MREKIFTERRSITFMLNVFRLSLRFFWREWCRGQWLIVFFAVLIAVSGITALNFYSDRLKRGIEENTSKFLGGDLVITSSTPIPEAWRDYAKQLTLRQAEVWSYPTVATAHQQMQLINLQAVSASFPLWGDEPQLQKNTIVIEQRLFPLLALKLNDDVTIGAAQFKVTRVLKTENALADANWLIAPRAMILLEDVAKTKTVIPGSRVAYRLLLAGDRPALRDYVKWIKPQLTSEQRLLDVHNQEERLTNLIDQIENFLQLGLLISLGLCSLAIILSVRYYLHHHYETVALLRSLGAKQNSILYLYLYKLMIVTLVAGVLGVFIGYFAQTILAKIFQAYLQFALPPPGWTPMFFGLILSVALVFIFAYPILTVLPKTSPLYLWRNDIVIATTTNHYFFISGFIILLLLIYSLTGFSVLTLLFLNFIGLSAAFLYALSLLLLFMLKKNIHKTAVFRRGLNQLIYYADNTSLQFISFTLMLMLIITLTMIRTNLIGNWQQSFSAKTPNYFAINIAPQDLNLFRNIFSQNNIATSGIYPLVRGRIIELNHQPIMQAVPAAARGNNALHRELNLTWMKQFPADNKVVAGAAWPVDSSIAAISVEKKLADDLQLKLGDTLTFQIGEQTIAAKIMNFRTVSWTSFHPNFFVIFMPNIINNYPTTYITSFHLSSTQTNFLNQIVAHFPNVTIIDVANLLKQVQDMISKITYASQYLLLFALGAGVLVLMASLQINKDERSRAYQLWRVLGASKKYIWQSMLIEWSGLVVMIVGFSYLLARVLVYLIEIKIFKS